MADVNPSPRLSATLAAPTLLTGGHHLGDFDCGQPDLNNWLKQRAIKSAGISARTFVMASGSTVIAYYTLHAGSIARGSIPTAKLRRNLPDLVPVVVIGRLAVDHRWAGKGLGGDILADAIKRVLGTSRDVAVRAIVVNAIDAAAARFYEKYGFISFDDEPLSLMLPLETAAGALKS